jgi:hypothetical protein
MEASVLYRIWAPANSVWSKWATPALFGPVPPQDLPPPARNGALAKNLSSFVPQDAIAVFIDLPADLSIEAALLMAERGYRPVPVINAVFGESAAIDMPQVFRALCAWTPILSRLPIAQNAQPAFFIDRNRAKDVLHPHELDNRWLIFQEDLPSAEFLIEQGIREILLIQESYGQPAADLRKILMGYQDKGIAVFVKSSKDIAAPKPIRVLPLGLAHRIGFRLNAFFGIGRSAVSAFGDFLDKIEQSGSGG